MQLASLDFLLFFFPVMILVGLCLRGRYRSFACGMGGLVYCALQGISVLLPMLLAVFGVRLLLSMMSEPDITHRRCKSLSVIGWLWLLGVVFLSRFWHGSVPLPLALCMMLLIELLLIYSGSYKQRQPLMPFGIYFGYCFGLMRLWAGPVLTLAQYEYIIETCQCSVMRLGKGMGAFVRGLAKLVLLAMPAAEVSYLLTEKASAHTLPMLGAVLGLVTMFFAIRYGLGGMAQMGDGMAYMLGYHYPEEMPFHYNAESCRGSWERLWGSAAQWAKRVFHTHMPSLHRGVRLAAFGVTAGLLFGRGWNGLLWGMLLALLFWAEPMVHRLLGGKIPSAVCRAAAVCLMLCSIGVLYAATFGGAVDYVLALAGANGFWWGGEVLYLLKTNWASLLGCVLLLFPLRTKLKQAAAGNSLLGWLSVPIVPVAEALLLIVCMGTLLVS